jgi:hypothetical protein
MASTALGGGVLSVEHIAGFGVIKPLWRGVPVEHVEVFAVVIGVALDARRSRWARQRISRVQAVVALNLVGDLAMTLAAPERGRAGGDHVALGTVGGAVHTLMGARERAGGYLAVSEGREEE